MERLSASCRFATVVVLAPVHTRETLKGDIARPGYVLSERFLGRGDIAATQSVNDRPVLPEHRLE